MLQTQDRLKLKDKHHSQRPHALPHGRECPRRRDPYYVPEGDSPLSFHDSAQEEEESLFRG